MMFPFTNNYKTGKERVSKVAPYTSWSHAKEIGPVSYTHLREAGEQGTDGVDTPADEQTSRKAAADYAA